MKWSPQQLTTASFFNEWMATILIQNEYNKVQILYYIYSRYANPKTLPSICVHRFYHSVRKRESKRKKKKKDEEKKL